MEMSIRGVSIMQDILQCLGSLDDKISIKSLQYRFVYLLIALLNVNVLFLIV